MYFFYPETAGRSLEDIDDYYRSNPPLLVFRDRDVTSSKRPAKYTQREEEEVRRASSIDPSVFRRGSRLSGGSARQAHLAAAIQRQREEEFEGKTEHGDYEQEKIYHKEDAV
jgi:hypothetical protein